MAIIYFIFVLENTVAHGGCFPKSFSFLLHNQKSIDRS